MTTRPRRLGHWNGVMLPLCMVLLATLPAIVVGENRTARTSADFFEALAVPNISAIYLANDIILQLTDAPPRYGHMARCAGFQDERAPAPQEEPQSAFSLRLGLVCIASRL